MLLFQLLAVLLKAMVPHWLLDENNYGVQNGPMQSEALCWSEHTIWHIKFVLLAYYL